MSSQGKWKEKRRPKYASVRFLFILISILVCRDFSMRRNEVKEKLLPNSSGKMYLIPFLRGQGLNNQLWEYRTSAIIAKATKRSLCIVPFHRFYLEKKGREFLPFSEIFSVESLQDYVHLVSTMEECVSACSGTLHRVIELVNKPIVVNTKKKPYPIADGRPGSLDKFKRSTLLRHIPNPTILNINENRKGKYFDSLPNISRALSEYSSNTCIAVAGNAPDVRKEMSLWNKHLVVSPSIQKITSEIKNRIFFNERYLSIHWRFEESKCAGFGIGIGNGRDITSVHAKLEGKYITRTSKNANICFYGGKSSKNPEKTWIRLLHKDDITSWIREILKEYDLDKIYLATDCKDAKLLEWIKLRTGAITVSDLKDILQKSSVLEDNDIVSRIEQEMCVDSYIFAGTQKSSWTTRVVEERLARNDGSDSHFNLPYKQHEHGRISLYFDEEICKKKSFNLELE